MEELLIANVMDAQMYHFQTHINHKGLQEGFSHSIRQATDILLMSTVVSLT